MRDALGIAAAVVIALLSQIVQPWTPLWWIGMAVAGAIALYSAGHLIWRSLPTRKKPDAMTLGGLEMDVAPNAAIAAVVAACIAVFFKGRGLAIAFALMAIAAVAYDEWSISRPFIWEAVLTRGYPIKWAILPAGAGWGDKFRPTDINVGGHNDSGKEVTLVEAYLISGMTGARLDLQVSSFLGLSNVSISDINPIPAGAGISLTASLDAPDGLSLDDFNKSWGILSLVVKLDDVTQRYDYDRGTVAKLLRREEIQFDRMPHVSLKNPEKFKSFVPDPSAQ